MKLLHLEENIKKCSSISLSEEKKVQLKDRLLAAIEHVELMEPKALTLAEHIKTFAREVRPGDFFKILLREKIATIIEFEKTSRWKFLFRGLATRKLIASLTVVVLVATVVFNFGFQLKRADAAYTTVLQEVEGDVTVVRDGVRFAVNPQFVLRIDDQINTGDDSRAVIRFLDESVSRLDQNTDITLAQLFVNPLNKDETIVEVIVNHGRLWSRVINLVDKLSRFQVRAKNTLAVVNKKAAFEVSVSSKGTAKVSAVQNRVDLVVATGKNVVETTLGKGFEAEVQGSVSGISDQQPEIRLQEPQIEHDAWIAQNLEKDKQYISQIKSEAEQKNRDTISVLPGNPLYAVKQLTDNTKIALTLDSLSKELKLLEQAREKLAVAEIFLSDDNKEEAAEFLADFQEQIGEITAWADSAERDDPYDAAIVRLAVSNVLTEHAKQLSLLLPDDPLYPLKETVASTAISVAKGGAEKTTATLDAAGDKLSEAHDLIEQGNTAAAAIQVNAYNKAVSQVVSDVKKLPSDEKEKAVGILIDSKGDDLKSLDALSVKADVGATVQKTISDAKTETLTRLGEALLDAQKGSNSSSPEVLQKIQDLKNIDLNGKPLIDLTVTKNSVFIKSDSNVISVRPAAPQIPPTLGIAIQPSASSIPILQTIDSKTPVSLPTQP